MKEKIITKKASSAKWVISDILGGIGWAEIFIILFTIFIISGLSFLANKITPIGFAFIALFLICFSIFLIMPTTHNKKLYQHIIIAIKFLFIKKTIKIDNVTNFQNIKENAIIFKDKIGLVFKIEAKDLIMSDQIEQERYINSFSKIFNVLSQQIEILKIDKTFNLHNQKLNIDKLLKKSFNTKKEAILKGNKKIFNLVEDENETKAQEFYLIVYIKQEEFKLFKRKIEVSLLSINNINFMIPTQKEVEELVLFKMFPSKTEFNSIPDILKQESKYIQLQENKFMSFIGIANFPVLNQNLWLRKFSDLENVNINIMIENLNDLDAIALLDKSIKKVEGNISKKTSGEIQNQAYIDHFANLIQMVQNGGEHLKYASVIFTVYDDSVEGINEKRHKLISELAKNGFQAEEFKYTQFEALEAIWLKKTIKWYKQEISYLSLAASFPFKTPILMDNKGFGIGFDSSNVLAILNPKNQKTSDKPNSNFLISGITGTGKTATMIKLIANIYSFGVKTYIIDSQHSFNKLVNYFNGQVIKFDKESKTIINPLQINLKTIDEQLELIEAFFKVLFNNLNTDDLIMLQKLLIELYKNKGINRETDINLLKESDYPILSDLNKLLLSKKISYSRLENALWRLTDGNWSNLWNGVQNIKFEKDLILFDTHDFIAGTDGNAKIANEMLMVALLNKKVWENKALNETLPKEKQEWICIAIDEAHELLNQKSIYAVDFINVLSREIRKCNGILILASQRIEDFNNDSLKEKMVGIFDNTTYHIIHRLNNPTAYIDLMSNTRPLNENEKWIVGNADRGSCLFTAGDKRVYLSIALTEEEFNLFETKKDLDIED